MSGADISEFSEKRTTVAARADYDDALAAAWASWRTVDKPIIAMIRGYCIGGGLMTAMKTDIRVAADGSEFAIPAAKLGLGYAYGGVEELMALVGPSWASEILFSARRLGADEALRIGLVNRVVPVDELEPAVRERWPRPSPRTRRSRCRRARRPSARRGVTRRCATSRLSSAWSRRASAPTTTSRVRRRSPRSARRGSAVA